MSFHHSEIYIELILGLKLLICYSLNILAARNAYVAQKQDVEKNGHSFCQARYGIYDSMHWSLKGLTTSKIP